MLKVCTSYSKKVPAEREYSSQQFHAAIEVELSDGLSPEELQGRIHRAFDLVKASVESELNGRTSDKPVNLTPRNGHNTRGNDRSVSSQANGNGTTRRGLNGAITDKQVAFIRSLAKRRELDVDEFILERFGCELTELTKAQASTAVDDLKNGRVHVTS